MCQKVSKAGMFKAKLERTLKKSDVEGYIIDALNSDAKTLIEILVERVTLYEDKIEISFRYSKNTNPDETLTEVHRDFLLNISSVSGFKRAPP